MATSILHSENFEKFLETYTWWSTILEKLLSCPLFRARLNEGRAMWIVRALFKKTLLLVQNLLVTRYFIWYKILTYIQTYLLIPYIRREIAEILSGDIMIFVNN